MGAKGGQTAPKITLAFVLDVGRKHTLRSLTGENQDGGVGRHTAPPRTTRTDRESNSKGDQHQGNRK